VKKGIPRERIAIINAQEAESSTKRQNISDDFNAGKLDVVIGNSTMSEGMNLQKRTTDIHHLDLPWEPASFQQRNGRGLRQGNISEAVRIHSYIAKGSFDGYRYQTMAAKKDWQDLLWNGGNRIDNLALEGAISRDEMMIMLSENPDEAREKMATNKAAAEERFKTQKNTDAAADFVRFQEMKRSYAALKGRQRETAAGERLRVRLGRLKVGLEANDHFKPKDALESDTPVLLQPQSGEAFREGSAFEMPTEGAIHGGGKFVVVGVLPQIGAMRVRRYGAPTEGKWKHGWRESTLMVELKDLPHAKPFEHDAKAEAAEMSAHFAAGAAEKLSSLKGLKDLHGLPSAVIESAYDAIQKQAKAGMKDYKFDTGHGDIGLVKPSGELVARSAYQARSAPDDFDLLLPTDEHRKKAIQAYVTDERTKKFEREAVTGRRGGHTGQSKTVLKYPGEYGHNAGSNRWGHIGDAVFGGGFQKEAHAVFEREQLEAARRAPTFTEALAEAAPTATGQYGTMGAWPKRALAILWAKAKREGKLDTPLKESLPKNQYGSTTLPEEMFRTVEGGGTNTGQTVRQVLSGIAAHRNMHDLAAAFAINGAPKPGDAVRQLLALRPEHIGAGLRHVIAKHPELGDQTAGEFARIERARAAYSYGGTGTPAHPLHDKFGDAAHGMKLSDLADRLTTQDDGGERDAA
jgi:hypothetical protein